MKRNPIIHLIDDDPAILEALDIFLATEGFTVRIYTSAGSFLDSIEPTEIGCIVTDIHMPEMNGLELLATLNERGITMPAIVITGRFDVELETKAMNRGAVEFFEKPFDPEILLASIHKALTHANDDPEI